MAGMGPAGRQKGHFSLGLGSDFILEALVRERLMHPFMVPTGVDIRER